VPRNGSLPPAVTALVPALPPGVRPTSPLPTRVHTPDTLPPTQVAPPATAQPRRVSRRGLLLGVGALGATAAGAAVGVPLML
jgi:hypothetical protein